MLTPRMLSFMLNILSYIQLVGRESAKLKSSTGEEIEKAAARNPINDC